MRIFKRLRNSKAGRNFGASIFSFIARMVSGLISIPIAVHYLSKEELGLWAAISALVAYLMWMDMGVGDATSRKITDAVVANDPVQINIWWTATQFALWVLGGITMLVGLCIAPFFNLLFNIPGDLANDAWMLFIGVVLCAALNFPLRAVPGLLTAQQRFHWVPIGQGIAPWFQVIVFFLMLRAGYGIMAYLYGNMAMQFFSFAYYRALVFTSPIRPRCVRKGVTKAHFKELFGFSLNLAVVGFKHTFVSSLAVIVLSRMAGLQAIPIYNISGKVSGILRSLATRVNHSFLPELINLHVAGKHEIFFVKYRRTLLLSSSVSLLGAAVVMLINPTVVSLLARPEFYAGDQVTMWFCLFLVVATVSSTLQALLQISGNMGKSIPVSIANVLIMLIAAPASYKLGGVAGLAAVFAFQPLFYGIYGLIRGARNCLYKLRDFMDVGMFSAAASMVAVIVVGSFMDSSRPLAEAMVLFGKPVIIPSASQFVCSAVLIVIACVFAWIGVRDKRPNADLIQISI